MWWIAASNGMLVNLDQVDHIWLEKGLVGTYVKGADGEAVKALLYAGTEEQAAEALDLLTKRLDAFDLFAAVKA